MVDSADLDRDGARALVATNTQALRLLRLDLTRRCAVPPVATITNFGAISRDLIALKSVAKVLSAEGRLAEIESRPAGKGAVRSGIAAGTRAGLTTFACSGTVRQK